jgi:hypothetical protein
MAQTTPAAVTGGAGNTTIVNQDEKQILDAFVASVPRTVAEGGDDPHEPYVNPQFRKGA